jgi:hypothetical protein
MPSSYKTQISFLMASRMNSWFLVKTLTCLEFMDASELKLEVTNLSIWNSSSEISEKLRSVFEVEI